MSVARAVEHASPLLRPWHLKEKRFLNFPMYLVGILVSICGNTVRPILMLACLLACLRGWVRSLRSMLVLVAHDFNLLVEASTKEPTPCVRVDWCARASGRSNTMCRHTRRTSTGVDTSRACPPRLASPRLASPRLPRSLQHSFARRLRRGPTTNGR